MFKSKCNGFNGEPTGSRNYLLSRARGREKPHGTEGVRSNGGTEVLMLPVRLPRVPSPCPLGQQFGGKRGQRACCDVADSPRFLSECSQTLCRPLEQKWELWSITSVPGSCCSGAGRSCPACGEELGGTQGLCGGIPGAVCSSPSTVPKTKVSFGFT